jgi:hypothetical protein
MFFGRMHAAVVALLVVAVGLGALPVLRYTYQAHQHRRQIARLAATPLETDVADLLERLGRLETRVDAFHGLLAEAEDELWFFKSRREPALILKDFGDDTGRIGLARLAGTYRGLREGAGGLRGILAVSRLKWQALREKPSPARYRSLAAELDAAAEAAGRHEALLRRYAKLLTATERRIRQLGRLAPQVADPVPRAFRALPGRLKPVRVEMRRLEGALHKMMRHAPAGTPAP